MVRNLIKTRVLVITALILFVSAVAFGATASIWVSEDHPAVDQIIYTTGSVEGGEIAYCYWDCPGLTQIGGQYTPYLGGYYTEPGYYILTFMAVTTEEEYVEDEVLIVVSW